MAWGTTGATEKCPHCGSEWWGPYSSWYYDPHEGEVTSEVEQPGRAEHHDVDCPRYAGVGCEDVT